MSEKDLVVSCLEIAEAVSLGIDAQARVAKAITLAKLQGEAVELLREMTKVYHLHPTDSEPVERILKLIEAQQ